MFCPKCGSMMKVKKHGSKKVLACSCGHTDSSPENMIIKEKTRVSEVNVIEEPDKEALPTTAADCPKCKNREAYYWTVQTRASDEPETKFLKCTKCRHIWRDYS